MGLPGGREVPFCREKVPISFFEIEYVENQLSDRLLFSRR